MWVPNSNGSGHLPGMPSPPPLVPSPIVTGPVGTQIAQQANVRFQECLQEKAFGAAAKATFDTVEEGTDNNEAPSANGFLLNAGKELMDLHKECLGENAPADLSPNYRGLFQAGDVGVNPIGGFWGLVIGQ